MKIVEDFGDTPAFEVLEPPAWRAPFVFDAPHSGTHYPRELLRRTRLDRMTLRRSEDTFVDALFSDVVSLGAPLMRAHFPRVYLDVNREAGELDPTMFDGPLTLPVQKDSARVAGGLGVIARNVGEQAEIYAAPLPAEEAHMRLSRLYHPYHATLAGLVETAAARFGACALVDCHSMPSGAVRVDERSGARPDVILGDRYGTSCAPQLTDELARLLRQRGFVVGRNRPYAGGYITERYGRPPRLQAIQLEINRALYMNEATFTPTGGFDGLRAELTGVLSALIGWFMATQLGTPPALAAE
jgi:N-formylglutamate amidohydrolase